MLFFLNLDFYLVLIFLFGMKHFTTKSTAPTDKRRKTSAHSLAAPSVSRSLTPAETPLKAFKITDLYIKAIKAYEIPDIAPFFKTYCTPDISLIINRINENTDTKSPIYKEIHGIDSIISYISNAIVCIPDGTLLSSPMRIQHYETKDQSMIVAVDFESTGSKLYEINVVEDSNEVEKQNDVESVILSLKSLAEMNTSHNISSYVTPHKTGEESIFQFPTFIQPKINNINDDTSSDISTLGTNSSICVSRNNTNGFINVSRNNTNNYINVSRNNTNGHINVSRNTTNSMICVSRDNTDITGTTSPSIISVTRNNTDAEISKLLEETIHLSDSKGATPMKATVSPFSSSASLVTANTLIPKAQVERSIEHSQIFISSKNAQFKRGKRIINPAVFTTKGKIEFYFDSKENLNKIKYIIEGNVLN